MAAARSPHPAPAPDGLEETYEVLPPPERSQVDVWRPDPEVEAERICPRCGYDMRGIPSSRCPECGSEYQDALLRRNETVESFSVLFSFRWVVYGIAPMFAWAFLAWFMLKFGGTYGYIAAFVTGVVASMGLAFWCASRAIEEHDDIEGLMLGLAVMLSVGFVNFSAIHVLLSL